MTLIMILIGYIITTILITVPVTILFVWWQYMNLPYNDQYKRTRLISAGVTGMIVGAMISIAIIGLHIALEGMTPVGHPI